MAYLQCVAVNGSRGHSTTADGLHSTSRLAVSLIQRNIWVTGCLGARQVTSEECQKEIFYFEKMEADDYRNDPLLAEACHQDVIDYCEDVEPGAIPGALGPYGRRPPNSPCQTVCRWRVTFPAGTTPHSLICALLVLSPRGEVGDCCPRDGCSACGSSGCDEACRRRQGDGVPEGAPRGPERPVPRGGAAPEHHPGPRRAAAPEAAQDLRTRSDDPLQGRQARSAPPRLRLRFASHVEPSGCPVSGLISIRI